MTSSIVDGRDLMRENRWWRVIKITLLFVLVAPFIGFVLLILGLAMPHWFLTGMPKLYYWQSVGFWYQNIALSYIIGVPSALIAGGAFAVISVFTRWRQLWVALTFATVPIVFVLVILGVRTYSDLASLASALSNSRAIYLPIGFICLFAIPTVVCWYLSRRWNNPVFLKRAL